MCGVLSYSGNKAAGENVSSASVEQRSVTPAAEKATVDFRLQQRSVSTGDRQAAQRFW
jgi:hypothetical protein